MVLDVTMLLDLNCRSLPINLLYSSRRAVRSLIVCKTGDSSSSKLLPPCLPSLVAAARSPAGVSVRLEGQDRAPDREGELAECVPGPVTARWEVELCVSWCELVVTFTAPVDCITCHYHYYYNIMITIIYHYYKIHFYLLQIIINSLASSHNNYYHIRLVYIILMHKDIY